MRYPVNLPISLLLIPGLFFMQFYCGCQSAYIVARAVSSDDPENSATATDTNTDPDSVSEALPGGDTGSESASTTSATTDGGDTASGDDKTTDGDDTGSADTEGTDGDDTESGAGSDTGSDGRDSATATDNGDDTATDTGSQTDSDVTSDSGSHACEETCIFPLADHVDLTYAVWGEDNVHFYVAEPAWAMAATQASRMLAYYFSGVLSRAVSPNWFLATALKESFLGCCESVPNDAEHPEAIWAYQYDAQADGCFQIEESTAFVEMKRIFPSHFSAVAHGDVIAGCNVASSALTMAFYDAFAFGMMFNWIDDADAFFSVVQDPMATETAFSLAYNRGVWSNEFTTSIDVCSGAVDMLECVFGNDNTVARDHAYAISRYIQDLDAAALEGRCYNGTVTTQDITDYVNAILPILAPNDIEDLRERSVQAFETAAGGESGPFQSTFGAVLEVLESAPLEDPFPQLSEWYGVVGPADEYTFSWPNIEDTCEIIVPVI